MMKKVNRRSLRMEMLVRVRMKALLKRNNRRKRIFDLSSLTNAAIESKCTAVYSKGLLTQTMSWLQSDPFLQFKSFTSVFKHK